MKPQEKKRRTVMNTKGTSEIYLTLRNISASYTITVLNLLATIELKTLEIIQLKEELSHRDLMEKPLPRRPHGR